MIDSARCEVLNATYEPLATVSVRRAMILVMKGKAIVTIEHPVHVVTTTHDMHAIPLQIRLNYLVKSRDTRGAALLTQQNMFARDKYCCQYCGRHKTKLKSNEFLTRDHVHPQSKGGLDVWTNIVTACNTCNNKKADFFLKDTNLKLIKQPTVPTVFEIRSKARYRKRMDDE
jgi:5-methylcytosine-specific restriction endonuclease McrA